MTKDEAAAAWPRAVALSKELLMADMRRLSSPLEAAMAHAIMLDVICIKLGCSPVELLEGVLASKPRVSS